MKKKSFSFVVALILLASMTVTAFASTVYSEGYFHYTIEDESVTIVDYFGSDSVVTVPKMIAGYPVNTIAAGAFANTKAAKVYLPDTIEKVEEGAMGSAEAVLENKAPADAPTPSDPGTIGQGSSEETESTEPLPNTQPTPSDSGSGKKFTDVPAGSYYEAAVDWALKNGVTSGKTETEFAPNEACTRSQVVTFLYRAAGSPAVSGKCPFTDVPTGSYYEKACIWAANAGITTGKTASTFAPNEVCTRGQIVTFLYRFASGKASGSCSFTDVKNGTYYYDAVIWAAKAGITTGKTASTFAPNEVCSRAQVVTFLFRCKQ